MATTVSISSITGASPYDVWVCLDCTNSNCQYIDTITTGDLTYSFTLPSSFENLSSYTIRIIDNNGCIICNTF